MSGVRRVAGAAEPGATDARQRFAEQAREHRAEMLAVVGDPTAGGDPSPEAFGDVLEVLGQSDLSTYWVPGPRDAPVSAYLRA